MSTTIDINDVYERIASSSLYGNLGIFAGAGFSKAVLRGSNSDALSWGELLEQCCEKLDVGHEIFEQKNISYPEVASKICSCYAEKENIGYDEASTALKREIAKLTNWYPTESKRKKYYQFFKCMNLNWILTTNYDLLLETVLSGRGLSLGPTDQLLNPRHMVPIYHLHGIRVDPNSIIITQEDYISLFRPSEYRQFKLPLLLKESTMILVGYGLGDINVLTALDWSKNVFNNTSSVSYPHDIIQLLHTKNPSKSPYRDKNDIIIVETSNIETFFEELCNVIEEKQTLFEQNLIELEDLNGKFTNPSEKMIKKFIDNQHYRQGIIKKLEGNETYLTSGFLYFLDAVVNETKNRAEPTGAFFAYDERLKVILDVLVAVDVDKMPHSLFNLLASSFEDVSQYIGQSHGDSWDAYDTWIARRNDIPDKTIQEMKDYYELKWWQWKTKKLLDF